MEPVQGRIQKMEEISEASAEERGGWKDGVTAGRTTIYRDYDPSGPLEGLSGISTAGGREYSAMGGILAAASGRLSGNRGSLQATRGQRGRIPIRFQG